jgi:hypothetical protein
MVLLSLGALRARRMGPRPHAGGLGVSRARVVLVVLAALVVLADGTPVHAQEIQLTGPLAGAPAVRRLRLHREGRFDIAGHVSFTLLDEYRRTIMPGLRATYHFFDWLGVGLFGGYGVQYNAALADELQDKAVDGRDCEDPANRDGLACKRSAVSVCRGADCLSDKQLGRFQWMVAPQAIVVPFRGKFSVFGALFIDADISVFAGLAIVGLQERKECTVGECSVDGSFELESRVVPAPTFGLGFTFYPVEFLSFGAEFRGTPFSWNTSGFDVASEDDDFPDDAVDSNDRTLRFNPMLSVFVSAQLPTKVKISD